jgi:hypothetical protein
VLSTNVIDGTVPGAAVAGLVVGGDQALRVDVLAGMAGDDDVIRGRVVVESLEAVGVRRRFPPVKHTVLPGVAASRAGRTSLDRMTVAVQSDGRPWLSWRGPDEAVHPAASSTLSPMGQTDGVGYPLGLSLCQNKCPSDPVVARSSDQQHFVTVSSHRPVRPNR